MGQVGKMHLLITDVRHLANILVLLFPEMRITWLISLKNDLDL